MNRNDEASFTSLLQSPVHMGLILLFGHFVHQNIRYYLSAFVKQALVKSLFLFLFSCLSIDIGVAALFRKARLDLRALASKKNLSRCQASPLG